MPANLQRLNAQPHHEPEDDTAPPPLPWTTPPVEQGHGQAAQGLPPSPLAPQTSASQQGPFPFPALNGGGIFAVPNAGAPDEIPGFPASAGGFSPVARGAGDPQATPGIQLLPGMAAPVAQPQAQAAPQHAQRQQFGSNPLGQPHNANQHATTPMPAMSLSPLSNTGRLNSAVLSGLATDHLATGYLDPYDAWFPEPRTILETGLNQGLIADLVLKSMYFTSYMTGQDLSSTLRLPFYGVIDHVMGLMKKEQLCDVSGTAGLGEAGYQYILTAKGMERAHQVLARSSYVGAAPVPLARYIEMVKMETSNKPAVTKDVVERSLQGMILTDELTTQVGAAVNAGKSLFLFGAPGNGKTLLAEKISTMLGGSIAIPYALEADGQIIQLFDLNSHRPVVPKGANETDSTKAELHDRRWVRIHRPVVVVGGELTMASLDLVYNENAGFYEAPFQLKANGGLFLIDDFGRQQVSPQALLNRWIVPLEKSIDYLTLKTGKKLQVPFDLFLVLSTNLQPEDLVDDAFLRRIQNKLSVPDPTPKMFYDIFVAQCKTMNIPFDQNSFTYLVNKQYIDVGRPFRASHPRDLLRQLVGLARYLNTPPELTPRLLDAACATYFVNSKKK